MGLRWTCGLESANPSGVDRVGRPYAVGNIGLGLQKQRTVLGCLIENREQVGGFNEAG